MILSLDLLDKKEIELKIDLCFFSGTGNTKKICDIIYNYLLENGQDVKKINIEKSNEVRDKSIKILSFPVAVHLTYPFILKWIEEILKKDENSDYYLITTLGGSVSGNPSYIKKVVKKTGNRFRSSIEITMPNNFALDRVDNFDKMIVEQQDKLKTFADKIINDRAVDKNKWKLYDLFNPIAKSKFIWNIMRSSFKFEINTNICTSCGLCQKICPVNNIVTNNSLEYLDKCELCMRCINHCPVEAISLIGKDYKRYKKMNISDIIN